MIKIENILVPLDFSPHSLRALETAISLAKTFSSRIHVLHAYHLTVAATAPNGMVIPQAFWDSVRDAAARKLDKAAQSVSSEGIACQTHLTADTPSAAIERVAQQVSADLIVMGTRGLTGLKHIFLGSVAERTIRIAPCPVMTLKLEGE